MNDTVSAIQNSGGDTIIQGETWDRNISLERGFGEDDYIIFKLIDASGTVVKTADFTTIEEDGSINITLSAAETAALPLGRYIMRVFVSVDGEAPYTISDIPQYAYVRM